jgi:hypothetical protein
MNSSSRKSSTFNRSLIATSCAALFLLMITCAAQRAVTSSSQPGSLQPIPFGLYALSDVPINSLSASRETLKLYRQSEARFDSASRAYGKGEYEVAAREFIAAADGFAPPPDSSAAGIFAKNRAAAYRNAVSAWKMADKQDEAVHSLSSARDRNPADIPLLDELLGGLDAKSGIEK